MNTDVLKISKSSGKCGYQQHYKAMIEATMISTYERFTDNRTMSYGQYGPVKEPSARKSLHQCTEKLDVKPKTHFRPLCAAKSKRKASRTGSMLFSSILK